MNKRNTVHGYYGTHVYKTWIRIRKRCYYSKRSNWKIYGGKGIKVCSRWNENFLNFLEDMGLPPSPSHQIDRINSDVDYQPDNCRWVTLEENLKNRKWRKWIRLGLTDKQAYEIFTYSENHTNLETAKKYQIGLHSVKRIRRHFSSGDKDEILSKL